MVGEKVNETTFLVKLNISQGTNLVCSTTRNRAYSSTLKILGHPRSLATISINKGLW